MYGRQHRRVLVRSSLWARAVRWRSSRPTACGGLAATAFARCYRRTHLHHTANMVMLRIERQWTLVLKT